MSRPARSRVALVWLVGLSLLAALPASVAAADTTPPSGSAEYWDFYPEDDTIEFKFTYADPESGLASIDISCDGGPTATYAYVRKLRFKGMDPAAGGCTTFGQHTFSIRVVNGEGLADSSIVAGRTVPSFRLEFPLPARTGQPFTIRPVYSDGYTPPPNSICAWDLVWGNTAAIRDHKHNPTYGGMYVNGSASEGYCGEWTFTLPWVPVPQFAVWFNGPALTKRSGVWPDWDIFDATQVGTDGRIRESNLVVAQILPSTYSPAVNEPITYRRYVVGGDLRPCKPVWRAQIGDGEHPILWEKWSDASTFTITPPITGDLFVDWGCWKGNQGISAFYDPPVRRADRTRPNTTKPVQTLGTGSIGSTVPVEVRWNGTDTGWGIESYKLQQRTNGGSWKTVRLSKPKSTHAVRALTPGTSYQFRVRAIDQAGNRGTWDYGPTFKPRTVSEASGAVTFRKSWTIDRDPTAFGGALAESVVPGASATYRFSGRDAAWIAERGPGHGKARVFVDGRLVRTVDLNAASDQPRRIVFARHWSSVGSHTIRIEVVGTVSRPIVDVDGFVRLH